MVDVVDHYGVLGLQHGATPEEIKKAHKKMALKYHPDKNEGNEEAAKMFMKIQESYQVLSDEKAKQAFDDLMAAKKEKEAKKNEMDKKRKAGIDALEERERAAKRKTEADATARYEDALKRMQEQNKRIIEEAQKRKAAENERKAQSMIDKVESRQAEVNAEAEKAIEMARTVKVKWPKKGAVDTTMVKVIFATFGEIDRVVALKKSGMVVFKENAAAANAVHSIKQGEVELANEVGLTAEWLSEDAAGGSISSSGIVEGPPQNGAPTAGVQNQTVNTAPEEDSAPATNPEENGEAPPAGAMPAFSSFDASTSAQDGGILSHRDYESLTMSRMRQMAERQRLIAEIEAQEAADATQAGTK